MQTKDTGINRDDIEAFLRSVGYWENEDLRKRNEYVLSPSVYLVSEAQNARLESLAKATYTAVSSLNDELCRLGSLPTLPYQDSALYRLAKHGVRKLLSPRDGNFGIPPSIKVDLVQDTEGRAYIAEVDVYNPRGYGFLAFLDASVPYIGRRIGPGIAGLAKMLREKQISPEATWIILVSEFERYYEPAFRILGNFLACFGIRTKVIRESEMAGWYNPSRIIHLLVIPESLNAFPALREKLIGAYRDGALVTLYPPAAYLGSKAFLPFLASQPGMSEFIPACELVGKFCRPNGVCRDEPTVLKAAVSSGLKKVIFSDLEPERFQETLEQEAKAKVPTWVLQQQVRQRPVPIVVFDDAGNRVTREYYLRITAYVTEDGVLGVEVTGRSDRKVHGAPDCIQIPCTLA